MAKKYKTRIETAATREPVDIKTRNETPEPQQRKPRRYIAASMPTVCPACGHNVRQSDGRHLDPVRRTVLQYVTCCKCQLKLAAGRPMTLSETMKYCEMTPAILEYEQSLRQDNVLSDARK